MSEVFLAKKLKKYLTIYYIIFDQQMFSDIHLSTNLIPANTGFQAINFRILFSELQPTTVLKVNIQSES